MRIVLQLCMLLQLMIKSMNHRGMHALLVMRTQMENIFIIYMILPISSL